jgi:hypothetical protein
MEGCVKLSLSRQGWNYLDWNHEPMICLYRLHLTGYFTMSLVAQPQRGRHFHFLACFIPSKPPLHLLLSNPLKRLLSLPLLWL